MSRNQSVQMGNSGSKVRRHGKSAVSTNQAKNRVTQSPIVNLSRERFTNLTVRTVARARGSEYLSFHNESVET
jgi:hypothetical protein